MVIMRPELVFINTTFNYPLYISFALSGHRSLLMTYVGYIDMTYSMALFLMGFSH